jgi:hypothetical protein
MKYLKQLDFYFPGLLAVIYPVIAFYAANSGELSPKFLGSVLPLVIAASLILSSVLLFVVKNKHKASLLSFTWLITFFSYGHISRFFDQYLFVKLPGGIVIGPDKVLLPAVFLLLAVISYKLLKSKLNLKPLIGYINLALGVLVIFLLASNFAQLKASLQPTTSRFEQNQEATNLDTPDIYHIILDGYAREDILRELYDYDNSQFLISLEKMGFFVAPKARANYMHTHLSLPSTFNLTYLDSLTEEYGEDPANTFAGFELMKENLVAATLKKRGYTTVNFATWWGGTDEGYPADIVYSEDSSLKLLGHDIATSQTNMVFLQTTLLSPLIEEVWGQALRGKVLHTLQKLPDLPYQPEKKFVLAHIITPHPPYMFQADGSPVPGYEVATADEGISKRPLYAGQVAFISRRILPILQSLINNSQTPPIIILQSDHGPASIFGTPNKWVENYSQEAVAERSGILYAVYLPEGNYDGFSESMTPVNTYRLIFNKYFASDYPLLPDRVYYSGHELMYRFEDITEFGTSL